MPILLLSENSTDEITETPVESTSVPAQHSELNIKTTDSNVSAESTSIAVTTTKPDIGASSPLESSSLVAKEHFVFTDPEGQLYHFSVEGNSIRDGTKVKVSLVNY